MRKIPQKLLTMLIGAILVSSTVTVNANQVMTATFQEVLTDSSSIDTSIKTEPIVIKTVKIENGNTKKTLEPYKVFGSETNQYALQQVAITDENGFRKVEDRYCVAMGSCFDMVIGQYFTLVLENGTKIDCVFGDEKADVDTDPTNLYTEFNGCMCEFIVESQKMDSYVRYVTGNASYAFEEWNSIVTEVIIYDKIATY